MLIEHTCQKGISRCLVMRKTMLLSTLFPLLVIMTALIKMYWRAIKPCGQEYLTEHQFEDSKYKTCLQRDKELQHISVVGYYNYTQRISMNISKNDLYLFTFKHRLRHGRLEQDHRRWISASYCEVLRGICDKCMPCGLEAVIGGFGRLYRTVLSPRNYKPTQLFDSSSVV